VVGTFVVVTIGKFRRVTFRRGRFFFVEVAGIKNGAFTGVSGEVFDESLATTHPFSELAKARGRAVGFRLRAAGDETEEESAVGAGMRRARDADSGKARYRRECASRESCDAMYGVFSLRHPLVVLRRR